VEAAVAADQVTPSGAAEAEALAATQEMAVQAEATDTMALTALAAAEQAAVDQAQTVAAA
jgi:hypothetical protein